MLNTFIKSFISGLFSSSLFIVIQSVASLDGKKLKCSKFLRIIQSFISQTRTEFLKPCIVYSMIVWGVQCVVVCKIGFTNWNAKIALLCGFMVVTYYIKLFRTGADRQRYFNVSTPSSRRDNKQLFIFNKKDTKLCSYCRLQNETTYHIFAECKFTIKLWSDLKEYCQYGFGLPIWNPQSATFWFFEIDPDLVILLNHILLYQYYIYSSRDSSKLSFAALLKNIKNFFDLEKKYIVRKWKKN